MTAPFPTLRLAAAASLVVAIVLLPGRLVASPPVSYVAVQDGAWNDPATWGGAGVPSGADAVTIAAGLTVDVTPGATTASLVVEPGATVRRYSGQDGVLELVVAGDVVNRGAILWAHPVDFGYDRLALRIGGDVTNVGVWDAEYTVLDGDGPQTITLEGDAAFGRFWADETPGSPLVAGSDLHFTGPVELRGSTLDLGAHRLRLSGGGWFDGGGGTVAVAAGGVLEDGPDRAVRAVRVEGPLRIDGTLDVGPGVVMGGPVEVLEGATLRRYSGPDGVVELVVEGDVTNRGTILWAHPVDFGYDLLALRVRGDVVNAGVWDAHYTALDGPSAQTITLEGGAVLGRLWADETPGSPLVAGSDLRFTGPVELRGSTLALGAQRLELGADGVRLNGGDEAAPGRIETAAGAVLAFPGDDRNGSMSLHNVRVAGPATFEGTFNLGPGVTVGGDLTVAEGAVLQRWSGPDGQWTLTVEGDVTNRGDVRLCHPLDYGYDRLQVDVAGDVINEGTWDAAATWLTGASAQTVTSSAPLGRDWVDADPSSPIALGSDVTFSGALRPQGGRVAVGPHRLAFSGTAGTLVEDGVLAFDGGRLAFEAPDPNGTVSLANVRVEGTVRLEGVVNHQLGVVLAGEVEIAEGTVFQRASGNDGVWPVRVEGALVNRGEVRYCHPWDYGYDRTGVDVAGGSVTNLGVWDAAHTRIVGRAGGDLVGLRPFQRGVGLEAPGVTPFGRVLLPVAVGAGSAGYDAGVVAFAVVAGSGLDSLTVEAFGDRPPATFANAVGGVVALRPTPAGTSVALGSLTLRYHDGQLGANDEAALEVYHSADGGQTWAQVSSAATIQRDPISNTVTLLSAPSSGLFALSSIATPLPGRPNVIVSVVGPDDIRVGPPNRYLLTYRNAGAQPTGTFVVALQAEGGVYVDAVEPSMPAGVPQEVYDDPSDFSPTGDSTTVALFAQPLEPGEERTVGLVLKTTRDIEGQSPAEFLRVAGRAGATGGTAYGYARDQAVDAGKGWVGDRLGDMLRKALDERIPGQAARDIMREALEAEEAERRAQEGPAGAVARRAAEKIRERIPGAGALEAAQAVADEAMMYALTGLWGNLGTEEAGAQMWLDGRRAMRKPARPVRSWDPNDKSGPVGVGAAGFVPDLGRMTYLIRFENKAEATAPAYEVVITDTLAAELDPETVEFGPTSWDGFTMTRVGNVLTWRATGIELPPNVSPPEGEGWVQFSVEARPGLPDGTAVANEATIVFDINDPIVTNTHVNTLDRTGPTTTMAALPDETPGREVEVAWASADAGAGPERATVYVSTDGGPFVPLVETGGGSVRFTGEVGSRYAFYALAADSLGNTEARLPDPVSTRLVTPVAAEDGGGPVFALEGPAPNPAAGPVTVRFSLAAPGETHVEVFDVLGRRVATLAAGDYAAGPHTVGLDAAALASGVYLVRLQQGDRLAIRQVTVAR